MIVLIMKEPIGKLMFMKSQKDEETTNVILFFIFFHF